MRELENLIQRAVVLCNDEEIGVEYFSVSGLSKVSDMEDIPAYPATLEYIEQWWIDHTLQQLEGNKTQAAKVLGIDVTTLHRKLRSRQ